MRNPEADICASCAQLAIKSPFRKRKTAWTNARIGARDLHVEYSEGNTRHSWFYDLPCHRSGDRRRLRALADLQMACRSTVAGNIPFSGLGSAVGCSRSSSASGLLRPFRAPRSRHPCPDLPNAALGCQRPVSVRAKPYVRGCPVADLRSRATFWQHPCSRIRHRSLGGVLFLCAHLTKSLP